LFLPDDAVNNLYKYGSTKANVKGVSDASAVRKLLESLLDSLTGETKRAPLTANESAHIRRAAEVLQKMVNDPKFKEVFSDEERSNLIEAFNMR
jgi:hypothetical protein